MIFKLIFLDVYATWCGPYKTIKVRIFTDREVGDFYNQHYNLSVDGEKSEGRKLIRKYGVTAYPTLIFVDGEGEPVAGVAGYHNSKQLMKLGEQVLNINKEN